MSVQSNDKPVEVQCDHPVAEFDANACCDRLRDMWLSLGAQIADCATDAVVEGRITKAVRWAVAAEACFWQATGESESFSIKDVLKDVDRTSEDTNSEVA
jgi:hypothetical protein